MQVQQGNGAGEAQAADAPLPTGRLLTYADITPTLKGRQAEVSGLLSYWSMRCVRSCLHTQIFFATALVLIVLLGYAVVLAR